MKKIVVLLALFMLLKPVFPLVEYLANYDYISKVLCENKSKPKMHCNGKCHLMKQLAKAAENEKPISSNKKGAGNESEVLFFHELNTVLPKPNYTILTQKVATQYLNQYTFLSQDTSFHPPTFS